MGVINMTKEAVYDQIANSIKQKIINGTYNVDEKIPTEAELAQIFSTSRTTVVKALDKLNAEGFIYRIQGSGSFIKNKRMNLGMPSIVSVIFPFEHNDLRVDEKNIVRGIESYLKKIGYILTVHYVGNKINEEKELIEKCKSQMSKGVILYPINTKKDLSILYDWILDPYPIVFLDKISDFDNSSCVCTDNVKGGYEATKYMIKKGYKDFYFVCDSIIDYLPSVRERYFGFCKALMENGFKIEQDHCISGFGVNDDVYKAVEYRDNPEIYDNILKNILEKNNEKGDIAIVAKTDLEALSIVSAAINLGIKIPDYLGVMGYDDSILALQSQILLSTMSQDYYNIGIKSAQMLVDIIENNNKPAKCSMFEPKLVIRESTR